jgi:hypothetical protein
MADSASTTVLRHKGGRLVRGMHAQEEWPAASKDCSLARPSGVLLLFILLMKSLPLSSRTTASWAAWSLQSPRFAAVQQLEAGSCRVLVAFHRGVADALVLVTLITMNVTVLAFKNLGGGFTIFRQHVLPRPLIVLLGLLRSITLIVSRLLGMIGSLGQLESLKQWVQGKNIFLLTTSC